MQFTASAELRAKIERATNLMRHRNPHGNLAVVVEHAVDLLIAALEKQRLAKTARPSKRSGVDKAKARRRYIPRAVRRAVFERDGERCTFVDETGRRCEARTFLELDHRVPHARGGTDDIDNLCVKCRRHNALAAERAFGRKHVAKKIGEKRARTAVCPRQRGEHMEMALRALIGLGFKEAQARRALAVVEERLAGSFAPLETVIREALSVLT